MEVSDGSGGHRPDGEKSTDGETEKGANTKPCCKSALQWPVFQCLPGYVIFDPLDFLTSPSVFVARGLGSCPH